MRLDRTKRRRARQFLTGGALLAVIAVVLLAIALMSAVLAGDPDELTPHIAKEAGWVIAPDWTKGQ